MDKKQALSKLKKELESRSEMPLMRSADDIVFGDGNPDTEIMFIGEAAGYWESVEHRPFVGQAGKLLIRVLGEILSLSREDVYISNIVKARPPENRDPTPEEIEAFRPYLDQEIDIIQPKIIVTLGRFSMRKFLGESVIISRVHGQPRRISWNGIVVTVFPMFHPAAALRDGGVMRDFVADFRKLASRNWEEETTLVEKRDKDENRKTETQLRLI